MKFKIIADGKPNGTRVVDAVTGEEVDGVVYIKVHADAQKNGIPFVELGMTDVSMEVVSENIKKRLTGYSGSYAVWP